MRVNPSPGPDSRGSERERKNEIEISVFFHRNQFTKENSINVLYFLIPCIQRHATTVVYWKRPTYEREKELMYVCSPSAWTERLKWLKVTKSSWFLASQLIARPLSALSLKAGDSNVLLSLVHCSCYCQCLLLFLFFILFCCIVISIFQHLLFSFSPMYFFLCVWISPSNLDLLHFHCQRYIFNTRIF